MAKSNTDIDKAEIAISEFSSDISICLKKLEEKYVHVKASIRGVDLSSLDKDDSEALLEELDKAKKRCDQVKDFLDISSKHFLENSVKLLKNTVQKRPDPGRSRDHDSGVYSADSRVLSSSNMPVTQVTGDGDDEEMLEVCQEERQVEHEDESTA